MVRNVLEKRKEALHTQLRILKLTFTVFYLLACVPAVGAALKIITRYLPQVVSIAVDFNRWADATYAVGS